jgi:hypothetical protein
MGICSLPTKATLAWDEKGARPFRIGLDEINTADKAASFAAATSDLVQGDLSVESTSQHGAIGSVARNLWYDYWTASE